MPHEKEDQCIKCDVTPEGVNEKLDNIAISVVDVEAGSVLIKELNQPTTAEKILKAYGILVCCIAVYLLVELIGTKPGSWAFVKTNIHLCLSAVLSGSYHVVLLIRTLVYGRTKGMKPWWVSVMFIALYVMCSSLHAWVALDAAGGYFEGNHRGGEVTMQRNGLSYMSIFYGSLGGRKMRPCGSR